MKINMKINYLLPLAIFSMISFLSFSQDSFNDKFGRALELLEQENYHRAIPYLEQCYAMKPKNSNVNFCLGYCYMQTSVDKAKAIPYFEVAQNDLTVDYRFGSVKEKHAPVEVIRMLGNAYHFDYQFDKAMEQYELFKSLIDENNTEDMNKINRDIRITRNAVEMQKNPVDVKITDLEVLNSEFAEYRPKVDAEDNVMFFTSRRAGGVGDEFDEDQFYFEDIYMSVKKDDKWQTPVLVGDSVNTKGHDACLYISPDAQLMYVYRFEGGDKDGGGSIYEVKKDGENWGEVKKLDASINSRYWETDASLNAYGTVIFFTSDRPGGAGERDIWMMKKLPNGNWAEAQNLGGTINTPYNEEGPYLHPDGKTLYFSSQGHSTMGGYDVFKTELQPDGTWSEPENIGYPVNTTGDDVFYFPTTDGTRAYFSSYREGGKGDQDLYMVTFKDEREKTLAIYKGIAKDSLGNVVKDLLITIVETESGKEIGTYRPNEETGKFLFILRPGADYDITYELDGVLRTETVSVNDEGGVQEFKKIVITKGNQIELTTGDIEDEDILAAAKEENAEKVNVTDMDVVIETNYEEDKKKVEELNQNEVEEHLESGGTLMFNNLLFVYDQVKLIDKSQPDLDKIIKYMKANPEAKIYIDGHTDANGDAKYNFWLSSARANTIKNYLFTNGGISYNRMKTRGYGESRPVAPNYNADGSDNPEGRQKNRRVEISLIK